MLGSTGSPCPDWVRGGPLGEVSLGIDHLGHGNAGGKVQGTPIPAAWQLWVASTGRQARL